MTRRWTPSLLVATLFATLFAALPASAQTTAPPLRIGTWNLEFLGDPANHRDKVPPRDDADLAAIGAYVRGLGVAVLAVQEVCSEVPLGKVAAAAGPSWNLVLGTTGGWDDGITAQRIGFLFDTARVELLSAEELRDFPQRLEDVPIFHRIPVTACFRDKRSGCDFRAVTVHLKASMKPDDLKKRKLEATVLRDWLLLLENGKREDQDIVVLGDFNSTYDADPETVLEGAGAVRYLRPATPTPTIMHFPEPIDQIAPSSRFQEIAAKTFAVHGPAAGVDRDAWRKTYSDHFPVTVDLECNGDDDPTAEFSLANAKYKLPVVGGAGAVAAAPQAPAREPGSAPAAGAGRDAADAAAPGAGRAPRRANAPARDPIDVGDHIEVVLDGGTSVRGTLLAPLGDWVFVREVNLPVRAIPVQRVREVRMVP